MTKPVKIILISVSALILAGLVAYCIMFGKQPEETTIDTSSETTSDALARATELYNTAASAGNSAQNISLSDSGSSTVTISSSGVYKVSGKLSEGQLVVNCKGEVILILDGVEIRNSSDAAILIEDSAHTLVYLADGSNNTLVSGTEQELTGASDDSATGAALYSRDSLSIAGNGAFSVGGYINNAIATTNHLFVLDGDINLAAVNNGLKGNDSVTVLGGKIDINCANDGIKSENDITIEGGIITIAGGTTKTAQPDGMPDFPDMQPPDMQQPGNAPDSPGMQHPGNMPARPDKPNRNQNFFNVTNTSKNSKGIVCTGTVKISGGDITITNSFEGIEGNKIYITGGNISIAASDDGINACGGLKTFGGIFGNASSDSSESPVIKISDGIVYVNADGDGLDSNGDLIIEGGYVIIDGPSDSANGALDSGSENGGVIATSGGTVFAIGASGMAETFGEKSTQYSFMKNFSGSIPAGTQITITDEDGKIVFEHTCAKSFNSVVFSSPDLAPGSTYTITAGNLTESVTIDNISSGDSAGGFGRGGFGR